MDAPERQLTLVSFYGEKPPELAAWIFRIQGMLTEALGSDFEAYSADQVHGTIIGLEGIPLKNKVCSKNFLQLRDEERRFDFEAMLNFLRHEFDRLTVQVGGFQPGHDYTFLSQGQHPFLRSFSLHNGVAVAMGWPIANATSPRSLDQLRRSLEPFGALRKWAWREGEVDNDFYFVLGRTAGSINTSQRDDVERKVREQMSTSAPLTLNLGREHLQFISYTDSRVPRVSSRVFPLTDNATTAAALTNSYGFCNR